MISNNIKDVMHRIEISASSKGRLPRLVAVSKEKPVEMVIEAYEAGQRFFGENKISALLEKSRNPLVLSLCPNIQWHFIGRMQSNKIKKLAGVNNLSMVETVDSANHADLLNAAWGLVQKPPLPVLIQVNTSAEPQKGGISPPELLDLFRHVQIRCANLQVKGLMCIGMQYSGQPIRPNPDFLKLAECRSIVCDAFDLPTDEFELSMGMSGDFEEAISLGSTSVRIGTMIFGER